MRRVTGASPTDCLRARLGARPYRRTVTKTLACRGILFDCDGVLLDSTSTAERAWSRWAVEYELSPDAVLSGLHGRRSTDTVSTFLPESRHAEGLARIEHLEADDVASIRPIPGVAELLRTLPDNWAIVTSATKALLAARLQAMGLPTAPVVITGDDVTAGKPAPDGYLAAAAALGLPIADCVVVEDSPAGIAAGRAAGAGHVLGVGPLASATDADPVVRDLRAVTWNGSGLSVRISRMSGGG
jgi:mannitol-1-/sugar-/sorbitol-6-phosphatase